LLFAALVLDSLLFYIGSMFIPHQQPTYLRSYGRVQGRKLGEAQRYALDSLLPTMLLTPTTPLPTDKELFLEIGFGTGEHLLHIATYYPEMLCLGAEPFLSGVAQCVTYAASAALSNVRILPSDVRPLLEAMPEACLSRVDILFPDPWPKRAHHKRRLVNRGLLDMLARVMRQGAVLMLVTDHPDYGAWMLEYILQHPDFQWEAKAQSDFLMPPKDWCQSRYARRAAGQGIHPLFLRCIRL
jgi:tRNA (guanine-N7-)-methyltransferase